MSFETAEQQIYATESAGATPIIRLCESQNRRFWGSEIGFDFNDFMFTVIRHRTSCVQPAIRLKAIAVFLPSRAIMVT